MYRKVPIRSICTTLSLSPEATRMALREDALDEERIEPVSVEHEVVSNAASKQPDAVDDLNREAGLIDDDPEPEERAHEAAPILGDDGEPIEF
jgi:hypothetical protein